MSGTPDQEEPHDSHPPLYPGWEGALRGDPAGWGSCVGECGAALQARSPSVWAQAPVCPPRQADGRPAGLLSPGSVGCPSLPTKSQGHEHATRCPCVMETEPYRQHTEGGHAAAPFAIRVHVSTEQGEGRLWGAQKGLPGSQSRAWGGGAGLWVRPGPRPLGFFFPNVSATLESFTPFCLCLKSPIYRLSPPWEAVKTVCQEYRL